MRLIDETPRTGIRGSRVAFLHPAAAGGVLTEIVQPAEDHIESDNAAVASALGFQGGQALSLRLADEELDEPARRRSRTAASAGCEIEADDGAVLVDLDQVIYLRVESDEHRIGF